MQNPRPGEVSAPARSGGSRLFAVGLIPLVLGWVAWSGMDAGPIETWEGTAVPHSFPGGWAGGGWEADAADPRVDSALAEMRVGRFFHASDLLKRVAADSALDSSGLFLLASAEAGYKNWSGVIDILQNAPWLDSTPGAWGMLGRARQELGRAQGAIEAYSRSLTADAAQAASARMQGEDLTFDRRVRQARLAALQVAEGGRTSAWSIIDLLADSAPVLATAVIVTTLDDAIEEGDTAFVREALMRVRVPGERDRLWEASAQASLAAGDTAAAVVRYEELLATVEPDVRKSIVHEALGNIDLAQRDSASARSHFLQGLTLSPTSNTGGRSASRIVDFGGMDADLALTTGRSLDRMGDGRRALSAYDTHVLLSRASGAEPDVRARVERARLAATVSSRVEEAVEEYRALDEHQDPAIGARVLELWAGLRRRQGQTANEATLREWLIERYPNTTQAAQVVHMRGDAAQGRRDWSTALRHYRQVVEMAPTRSQAGMGRMRIGQILLTQGDVTGAEATYSAYLADFPDGAQWEEASYWAARTRVNLGNAPAARPLLDRLRLEEPFDYYTVVTGDLLGESFAVPTLPPGSMEMAPSVRRWVEQVKLLDASGFTEIANRHVQRVIDDAASGSASPQDRLALAHALNELGRTIDGINLGWALRREGMPWSQTLLTVVYPFPFREMIEREAEEWGLDPILVGALIRQESAFVEAIKSSAGAVGLMQVMPATGAEVARAVGPRNFTPASLETAEVNLHLGSRFLTDMLKRFGPELPLVLSAYNAGPTRANRWKDYPEISELDRFTERIPFAETRGYVKNITRNVAIYRAIYGVRAILQ